MSHRDVVLPNWKISLDFYWPLEFLFGDQQYICLVGDCKWGKTFFTEFKKNCLMLSNLITYKINVWQHFSKHE